MSMSLFDTVLMQAVDARMQHIRFVGLGEPLMHPQIDTMIRRATDKGFYTELTTNATLLGAELIGTEGRILCVANYRGQVRTA
jgi:MoaA/NifB/PqqE/SkfB family radical SAM enzyme